MKNNLFICSNILSMLISSTIIDEKFSDDNNVLLVVTNHIDTKFIENMVANAKKLGCFSKILCFNDYSDGMGLNKTITLKNAKNFYFEKFEKDINVTGFDNIFYTLFYFQARTLINHYKKASVFALENGTASYFPQKLEGNILQRTKAVYSLNYFDVIKPLIIEQNPKILNIAVDKNKIKEKFEILAKDIDFEENENSVIFCAHNLSLNKNLISANDEFEEYSNVIRELLAKGFTVYFKEHPKTPDWFYNKFRTKFNSSKFKILKSAEPVEAIALKIKPRAVVSAFSTSLLTVPQVLGIPAYTFKMKNNLTSYPAFSLAYAMIMAYIPTVDKFDQDFVVPVSDYELKEEPLTQISIVDTLKNFVNRKLFTQIQQNIQSVPYENFGYFQIPVELYNIYKAGSYWTFLSYYAEAYVKNIKEASHNMGKFEFFMKSLKIFRELFVH